MISLGALESVLKLLQGNYSKLVLRRVYWILLNFLAPTEPLLPLDDVQDILPVFCQLLDHNNKTQVRPDYYRPLIKSAQQKNGFLISKPKHMLSGLKRTVSMRWFF